jgi:hypothetical protein
MSVQTQTISNCNVTAPQYSNSAPRSCNGVCGKTDMVFKCTHEGCFLSFSTRYNLAAHDRSHTGDKSFFCTVCNIGFVQRGNLTVHTRSNKHLQKLDAVSDAPITKVMKANNPDIFETVRDNVKASLMEGLDTHEGETLTGKAVLTGLSAAWKELDGEQLSGFKIQAEQHLLEMDSLYTENPDERPEKKVRTSRPGADKFDATQVPETPEGWTRDTGYIALTPIDPETGKGKTMTFKSFDEAVANADELGDACGGITRTSRGFSLRRGNSIKGVAFTKDEISWMKPH